ncbi:winged helix-turn-helix transcriptional regulator [Micromonospora echinofusca]|uniref:Transcriptional regulator n=1 Tax=Micromonospora echinofusca TaxID=47858 RepID=A0ABS3VXD1_MICEH|nr:winged helix-turn-helix transcriptional regulator [Micromonospora echinofusca]MBO4209029.1 transcriptional regulator [Micromonospora echinofusca]
MGTHRSYQDSCGLAHALDLVGERWALLVVRELVLGPKRYRDLRADLPGISTNVLANRLDELTAAGVVRRYRLAPPAGTWVYELTDWGRELEPVLSRLGRWGARSPARRRDGHLSATALILSLRTNFDPGRARGWSGRYELRIGEERFRATVRDGTLDVGRGVDEAADATVTADPATLAGLIYGGGELAGAVRTGAVTVTGDLAAVDRFLTLFPLPDPVPVGST